MNNLLGILLLLLIVCGLYYFWYKCQMFAVSKVALIMGLLFWPIGVVTGIYWAIKDFFVFRKFSREQDSVGADSENKLNPDLENAGSDLNYVKESKKFLGEDLDKYAFSAVLNNDNTVKKSEKTIAPANEAADCGGLTLDEAYLQALDEYESKNLDRALYARLLAESDGKEELVKSRYIKLRAENLLKDNNPS